jgi:hypothetical protein
MDFSSDEEGDEDASEQDDIFSYLLSDDDDEDDEIRAAAVMAASFVQSWMRNHKWQHTRLVWEKHVTQLHHERLFERTYQMSYAAFMSLKDKLGRRIVFCNKRSSPEYDTIPATTVMATGIRYLAGCPCLDIHISLGISLPSVYRCRDVFLKAVNDTPELKLVFPQTIPEIQLATQQFKSRSQSGIVAGCVGCIDGYLAVTTRPKMDECNLNPGAFYSGHYGVHGLNVQAVCDYRSRFIFFAVVAPGKCSDQVAFERTSLSTLMEALPTGTYLVGDAAYSLTERMLVPFTGSQRNNASNDAYNFYLSQLRIRIEMAFGLMTNKWRILRAPLQTSLAKSSEILECCSRLHNFCIQEDGDEFLNEETTLNALCPMPMAEFGWGYLPTVQELAPIAGTSQMRDIIVRRIDRLALRRPAANVERYRYELHQINLM